MTDGPAQRALREALSEAEPTTMDRAAVQLARRYAGLLDNAAPASRYRVPLEKLDQAVAAAELAGVDVGDALDKIRDALSAHSVASDLGPKYLAVLAQLGLTPGARGASTAPATPQPEGPSDELRKRRDDRKRAARAR
jgi:hypothetical protein